MTDARGRLSRMAAISASVSGGSGKSSSPSSGSGGPFALRLVEHMQSMCSRSPDPMAADCALSATDRYTIILPNMPIITIVLAILLIALGVVCRLVSDSSSMTLLIPAIIGCLFLVAGLVALKPGARKHAMHAAAMLALLGIGGSIGALIHLPALLSGAEVQRPLAVIARSLTFGLCAVFLVLAIRSFIAARRARRVQTSV